MSQVSWPLENDCPAVQVVLRGRARARVTRTLLADTGAGPRHSPFELVLSKADCQRFGVRQVGGVGLGGAYSGVFPVYVVSVEVPALNFAQYVTAVAVPAAQLPPGLEGIAAFRFLNRFHYGNFGDPNQFALETF